MNINTIYQVTIGRTIDDKFVLNFSNRHSRETTLVADTLEEAFQKAGSVLGVVAGQLSSEWDRDNEVKIITRSEATDTGIKFNDDLLPEMPSSQS